MQATFQSRPTPTGVRSVASNTSSTIPGVERCISCRHVLQNAADRSEHYHSEWHRYNVKRRCAGLKPLPKDVFNTKFSAFEQSASGAASSSLAYRCRVCKKSFKTAGAAQSHSQTKKHKKMEEKYRFQQHFIQQQKEIQAMIDAENAPQEQTEDVQEPPEIPLAPATTVYMDGSDVIEIEARRIQPRPPRTDEDLLDREPIEPNVCIFCNETNLDEYQNAEHMMEQHGFVVPYKKRLKSLFGLLENAGIYVGVFYQCPWCWVKFGDVGAVQNHMKDVGHCKLSVEGEESPFGESFDWGPLETDETRIVKREDEGIIAINEYRELVRGDGTVIGHRKNLWEYKQKPVTSTMEVNEQQFIAQLNNPLHSFKMQLAQKRAGGLNGQIRGRAKATRDQANAASVRREDTAIGVSTKAHTLVRHFRDQNPKFY